jgi:ABC-type transport system involved in multi-copper enzyme maturation permease subunit
MEAVAVLIVIFGTLFGITYLFFSTRNKERLALIEKGADASIFMKGQPKNAAPFWKVLILNISLLLMGIGLGVFLGLLLETYSSLDDNAVYPAMIFFMAGVGLFVGFNLTKKLDK